MSQPKVPLFMDTFDTYGSVQDMLNSGKWNYTVGFGQGIAAGGGRPTKSPSNALFLGVPFFSSGIGLAIQQGASWAVGFAFMVLQSGTNIPTGGLWTTGNNNNNSGTGVTIASVGLNLDQTLSIYMGDGTICPLINDKFGTVFSTHPIKLNTWHWLEVYVVISSYQPAPDSPIYATCAAELGLDNFMYGDIGSFGNIARSGQIIDSAHIPNPALPLTTFTHNFFSPAASGGALFDDLYIDTQPAYQAAYHLYGDVTSGFDDDTNPAFPPTSPPTQVFH